MFFVPLNIPNFIFNPYKSFLRGLKFLFLVGIKMIFCIFRGTKNIIYDGE
jgi:hypothetical protein